MQALEGYLTGKDRFKYDLKACLAIRLENIFSLLFGTSIPEGFQEETIMQRIPKAARAKHFLRRLYNESEKDTNKDVNTWVITNALGFDEDTTSEVLDTLLYDGFIEELEYGILRITHKGSLFHNETLKHNNLS